MLQRLITTIDDLSVNEEAHKQRTSDLRLISLLVYEEPRTVGDIDLNSFTFEELKSAFEEIREYESDEHESDYETLFNIGNGLLEINRLAHISKVIKAITPIKKKRRFF